MIPVIFVDEGLELRPVTRADSRVLNAAIERNRARLREWLPWAGDGYSASELVHYLGERETENAAGEGLALHIWMDEVLCGSIALHRFDLLHRQTSIGYWLDSAWEGRGIMTRACRALVTEGFRRYGLHRIEIRCGTGNEKSCAIPQRLGFVEEGILREAELVDGRWLDLRVFGMLDRDWR